MNESALRTLHSKFSEMQEWSFDRTKFYVVPEPRNDSIVWPTALKLFSPAYLPQLDLSPALIHEAFTFAK